jgi:hypothetical protein
MIAQPSKIKPCRRCGGTARTVVAQTFSDGSTHNRQQCAQCGKFQRYLPWHADQPQPRREIYSTSNKSLPLATCTPTTPGPDSALANSQRRCRDHLDALDDAVQVVKATVNAWDAQPPDLYTVAATSGGILSAVANLSPEAIAMRAARLRGRGD